MLRRLVLSSFVVLSAHAAAAVCPIRDVVGLYKVTHVRCEIDGKPCEKPDRARWVRLWMESDHRGWIGVSSSDPFGGYYAYGFDPDLAEIRSGSYYGYSCSESTAGGQPNRTFFHDV